MLISLIESVLSLRLSPDEDTELPDDYMPHSWLRIGLPILRVIYPLILAGGWFIVVLRALG